MRRWLLCAALLGIIFECRFSCVESFSVSPSPIRTLLKDAVKTALNRRHNDGSESSSRRRVSATKGDETWSRTGSGGSRLGVRRRVRKVLNKARNRTGVSNDSEKTANAGGLISETVSMGLYDEIAEIEFRETGKNGVSTVYPRNDTVPPRMLVKQDFENEALKASGVTANGEVLTKANGASIPSVAARNGETKRSGVDVDALLQASVPAVDPLPFSLPRLSEEQCRTLLKGERVQEQSKMGREGSGYVVMDIPAPAHAVWECLLDFEAYPKNIGTVRSMRMFTNTHLKQSYIAEKPVPPGTGMETRRYGMASISRAAFTLSKFRLKIAAIHKYHPHPDGHYMVFTLDKACTNAVLQDAKGIWYTQENPDGREGYTRVWLLCELKVSPMLPTFIVDYAANRAMPRATTWLAPTVEEFCRKWYGPNKERSLPPK